MFPIPFPIPWFSLYFVTAYLIWWALSRAGLLGAWYFSRPGDIRWRQWVIILLSLTPITMEMIASILVILALALGYNPVHGTKNVSTA